MGGWLDPGRLSHLGPPTLRKQETKGGWTSHRSCLSTASSFTSLFRASLITPSSQTLLLLFAQESSFSLTSGLSFNAAVSLGAKI